MEFKKIQHLKWRQLNMEVAYRIKEKKIMETATGDGMVLILEGPTGNLISAWAPNSVRTVLEDSDYTYIRSCGLKEKKSYYWDFEVAMKEPEMWS